MIKLQTHSQTAVEQFLKQHGWGTAEQNFMAGDWAPRKYYRLQKPDGQTAILMIYYDWFHEFPVFLETQKFLAENGVRVPEIYASDGENAITLLEDMGDQTFDHVLKHNTMPHLDLYLKGYETLENLQGIEVHRIDLPSFFDTAVFKAHRRIIDWYAPVQLGKSVSDDLVASYQSIWSDMVKALPEPDPVCTHIDYHPGNLMLLPNGDVGVLDFQALCIGPRAYDWVNLLEDIRRDVPEQVKVEIEAKVKESMTTEQGKAFDDWYDVLHLHFYCRILGQIPKLMIASKRDDLYQYFPRVAEVLHHLLQKEMFSDLKDILTEQGIDLGVVPTKDDILSAQPFIRKDAF